MSEEEEEKCPDDPRLDYSECESLWSLVNAIQALEEMGGPEKMWLASLCLNEVRLILGRGAPIARDAKGSP